MVKIENIQTKSAGEISGLKPNDLIVKINGNEITDRLDFTFYSKEDVLEIEFRRDGVLDRVNLNNNEDYDTGIEVEDLKIKHCGNNCVFCFVSQNPKGMRKSIYVKDEDYRFSFLYGNYFTLTNTTQEQLDRIVKQRFSPLYISVHAVDQEVRRFLLGNMGADNLIPKMNFLADNNIEMHTQIVLCPDINDGQILDETIMRMYEFYPHVQSVAVVPLGKTMHRDKLTKLRSVTKEDSIKIINQINSYHDRFLSEIDTRFVFPADEFYLKAEICIPDDDYYESYDQYEDGIGMVRSFINDFEDYDRKIPKALKKEFNLTFVTGKSFATVLHNFVKKRLDKVKHLNFSIITAENYHYGPEITVAGLLTGNDIIRAFEETKIKTDLLVLPDTCIGHNELFLDDLSIDDVVKRIGVKTIRFNNFEEIFDYVLGVKNCSITQNI